MMNFLTEAWVQLKCLLQRLMDSNDSSADSVVVCGVLSTISLGLIQMYATTFGLTFDALNYGMGAAAIVGAIGGGVAFKTMAKGKTAAKQAGPNMDEVQ